MADIKISELTQAESLSLSDLMESAVPYNGGFLSRRMSLAQLSNYLENYVQHTALTTEAKTIVSAINEIVSDLANYYTTSQTYSKTEVDQLIAGVSGLHFEVVQQLPTTDIDMNTIYLVPKQDSGQQDVYDEYICLDDTTTPATWEKIGTTEIDLSDYVTDTELSTILNDYVTSSGLNTILADYATTSAMTTALADKVDKVSGKGLSTEDYTTTEKAKLNGIESGAEVNPIVATGSVFGSLGFDNVDKLIKLTADAQGSGKDLNDYKTEGFYYFDSNNIPTNIPTGNVNGFLAVIKSGNVVKQLWFRQGSETTQANTYVRLFMSSSSTWSTWRKYATTDDIPIVTDENVKQTAVSSSSNANYRLLLSKSASDSEETDGVYKDGHLYFNPYDETLTTTNASFSTAVISTAKVTSLITSQYYFNLGSGSAVAMLEANSASTTSNPTFVTLPASSGTLALQSELPTNPVLWSENNLLGAKNLIPINTTEKSHTQNNVQFTLNEDGSIKAHITGTGNGGQFDVTTKADENLILLNGTYIFSGCPSGGSSSTYRCRVRVYNITTGTESSYGFDTGSGVTVTVNETEGKGIIEIACLIYSGYNGSDLLFKPMIRPSSIADDTYTPPAQTNRQLTTEKFDWSVQNLVGSKNILQYPYTEVFDSGLTVTYNNDGSVKVSCASQTGTKLVRLQNRSRNNRMWLDPTKIYKLSCVTDKKSTASESCGISFIYYNGSTSVQSVSAYANVSDVIVNSPSTTPTLIECYLFIPASTVLDNETFYPMVRNAEVTNDEWEPFADTNRNLSISKADYRQIADIEKAATASRAYAKNELMIWDGKLYRVTTAISSGGAISGKVTATTLSAEIKAIRDALNI